MNFWYKPKMTFLAACLWPLSILYKKLAYRKYQKDLKSLSKPDSPAQKLQVPVIVVGNITVGGTGKTPMVRFLFRYLHVMGFKIGVISRGYGGKYKGVHHVQAQDTAELVGDEIAMQYAYCQRQGLNDIEFVVARERIQAALKAQELGCNFIISDDGLQHYCLPRHLEIAVVGPQGLGNKLFIPAGPLREAPQRLRKVDFVINNSKDPNFGGYSMNYHYLGFLPVKSIDSSYTIAQNLEQILEAWRSFLQVHAPQSLVMWQEYLKRHPAFLSSLATRYFGYTQDTRQEYLTAEFNRPEQVLALESSEDNNSAPLESYNQITEKTTEQTAVSVNKNLDETKLDPDDPLLLSKIEEHIHLHSLEQLQHMAQKLEVQKQEHQSFAQLRHKIAEKLTKVEPQDKENSESSSSPTNYEQELENLTSNLQEEGENTKQQETEFNLCSDPVNSVFNPSDQFYANASVKNQELVQRELGDLVKQARHTPEQTKVSPQQAKALEKMQLSLTSHKPSNFNTVEDFLEYIDKQLDPGVLSYKYLLAKSRSLISPEHVLVEAMQAVFPRVNALCAIGYPQGFKQTLTDLGFTIENLFAFPDHHTFKQEDLDKIFNEHPQLRDMPLLVTEKDAIKLKNLTLPPLTFFLEREGYFAEHSRWLESLKNRLISIYTSGVDKS
ncbi:tetraacyldisaccharide 4'-kinase [Psittacicella gerlachiana]|uniref:Tetraacyldisaccharide 4'-kinase n=1 Tax=Psittacicella gerlachiana TaxID=2028574 RepID=A0A3A1YJS0_9GAMM|nr:tetraacyldisaccharide 4'-kinase [Psittacicella gerlachiana]RIY37489.1 tetraacyldisaccharide 4'-kinase [Psittacicella gerlachiana]